MMRSYFFSAVLFVMGAFFVTGCKKKEVPAPVAGTATLSTATCSGFLYAGNTVATNDGGIIFSNVFQAKAYFSSKPVTTVDQALPVEVGSILINNDSLFYVNGSGFYTSLYLVNVFSTSWNIQGGNAMPDFTFTEQLALPTCASLAGLPDSISISSGTVITVNSVSSSTNAKVIISDNLNHSFSLPLANGHNTVPVSAANFSSFKPGTLGLITVYLSNETTLVCGSKRFRYIKFYQYYRNIWMKN